MSCASDGYRDTMSACLSVLAILYISVCVSWGQLVVNVKNRGGDVIVESINANTTDDTIQLEFKTADGTFVTQFIDFKSEVQILRALILGEEERGQTQYQILCFVLRFVKNEFISSDAMSKLRQKNPSAIRTPEDDRGQELQQLDLLVDLDKSQMISPVIYDMCREAKDTTFTKEADVKLLSKFLGKDASTLASATKHFPFTKLPRCSELVDLSKPCLCHYEICVGWYPCGLKYCRGKDSTGRVVSYRCGIKTCRKCRVFEHYARQKMLCIWDEV
ncbi:out at first protein-like [Liolophura sinensis]|uniref:out at first protein-like n=1 Tax=Liolophura sinensis TaxID=3198878 RepID=UPI0031586341